MKTAITILVLLACAAFPRQAAADCVMNKVADLPVTMVGPRAVVKASINGVEGRFFIDTGAVFSSLTQVGAAKYNLPSFVPSSGPKIEGFGGSTTHYTIATADILMLGGVYLDNPRFVVLDRATAAAGASELDGAIGQDVMSNFDVEYDLPEGVVRLFKPHGCEKSSLAYWAADEPSLATVDLQPSEFGHPMIRTYATLSGVKLMLQFDSGSVQSVTTTSAAAKAGVRPGDAGVTQVGYITGVAQKSYLPVYRAIFSSFDLGGREWKNVSLLFGATRLTDADMQIGMEFFLSHRMLISNSQGKLYIAETRPAVPDPALAPTTNGAAAPQSTSASAAPDADGFARLATAAAARQDFADAVADFDQAIRLNPNDPRLVFGRGVVEYRMKQPQAALSDLNQALVLKPDFVQARLARVELLYASGKQAEANADLAVADQVALTDPDVRLAIADHFELLGEQTDAIGEYDQWISAHPKDDRLAQALDGRCRARTLIASDMAQALADCNAALELTPGEPHFLSTRGLTRLRLGDLDGAIADDDASLRLAPQNAWTLYTRGLAKLSKGQLDQSEADLRAAAAVNPAIAAIFAKWGLTPDPAAH